MPAPYERHHAQLKAILLAWGMPEDNAEATADILGWADLHGVDSHGISVLPGYDRLRRTGRANMAARPHIIKETPVSALVDGDGGLGHVPARFAMQVAIEAPVRSCSAPGRLPSPPRQCHHNLQQTPPPPRPAGGPARRETALPWMRTANRRDSSAT
jgi:hypothetical protein